MEKIWSDEAWDDYLYWQTQDKKTLKIAIQILCNHGHGVILLVFIEILDNLHRLGKVFAA